MYDFAVDLGAIAPGVDFSAELSLLAQMHWDGLVEINGTKLAVTSAGRAAVRVVAAAFDTYRSPQAAQFSKAI
jgi:oxygen-independent coproporphyrinogen-3 oxidase